MTYRTSTEHVEPEVSVFPLFSFTALRLKNGGSYCSVLAYKVLHRLLTGDQAKLTTLLADLVRFISSVQ